MSLCYYNPQHVSHVIVLSYCNPQHQSLTSLCYVITIHNISLSRHSVKLLQSTTSVSRVIVLRYYNPQHQSLTSFCYVIAIHISLSRRCVTLLQSTTSVSHVIVLSYYNPQRVSHVTVLSYYNPNQSLTSVSYHNPHVSHVIIIFIIMTKIIFLSNIMIHWPIIFFINRQSCTIKVSHASIWCNGGTGPHILNLDTRLHASGQASPAPIKRDAGCASETVWTFWMRGHV
jgi:hypothetical protein